MKHIARAALIVLAMSALIGSACAAEPLLTITGESSRGMDQFALVAHARATRVTNNLGVEVCGEIEKVGSTFVLALYTSGSDHYCMFNRAPNGTGVIFHTHPVGERGTFADADYAIPGYLSHGRTGVTYQSGRGTERKVVSSR